MMKLLILILIFGTDSDIDNDIDNDEDDMGLTSIAAQQRLVGEVVDEVLQRSKVVEAKRVAAVPASHVEVFDRLLGPAVAPID